MERFARVIWQGKLRLRMLEKHSGGVKTHDYARPLVVLCEEAIVLHRWCRRMPRVH